MRCSASILPALLFALLWTPVLGEEEGLHTFTNKQGEKIEAELLEVSRDRRTVKIRRADGAKFEAEIVLFSLDDQQHIKDWLEEQDWKADYSLDLALAKKLDGTVKRRSDDLRIDTSQYRYEIALRNLSREPLADAKLRYALIRKEVVAIVDRDDDAWSYRLSPGSSEDSQDDDQLPRIALRGEIALETLAFNHETALLTAPVSLDKVALNSNPLHEDALLGAIVQVVSQSGEVLAESRTGSAEVNRLEWDDLILLETEEAEDQNDPADLLSVVEAD